MKKSLFFTLLFTMMSSLVIGQEWNFQQKLVAAERGSNDAFSSAVDISENFIAVGAIYDEHNAAGEDSVHQAGAAYVFGRDEWGNWIESQKLVANDRMPLDHFGCDIAISGNYLIVGARRQSFDADGANYSETAGAAYIFERNESGNWEQVQKLVASDREADDFFGYDVAITGTYAVVGALSQDYTVNGIDSIINTGAVYIFERSSSGQWTEVQKINASDSETGARFGVGVSISGDHLLVGASNENNNPPGEDTYLFAGAAYIFQRQSDGKWTETQKLTASNMNSLDFFGFGVAIDDSYAVIGAFNRANSGDFQLDGHGSAYIFEQQEDGYWEEIQMLEVEDGGQGDWFGFRVDISGDFAIIGAGYDDDDQNGENALADAGSAYIFKKNNTVGNWEEVKKLTASQRNEEDYFGEIVAISGNNIICSAVYEDEDVNEENTIDRSGSAYYYKLSCPTGTYNVINQSFSACGEIEYNGNTYIESQVVTDTFVGIQIENCDTIRHTELIIHPIQETFIDTTIFTGESITVGNNTYSMMGTYIDTLSSTHGCDSIIYTTIQTITNTEDIFIRESYVKIYPNPATQLLNLEAQSMIENVKIFDQLGRLHQSLTMNNKNSTIDINSLAHGIYFLEIELDNGIRSKQFFIKE